MKRILLTGAAGIVGQALRPLLAARYEEILITDQAEAQGVTGNETFVQGDITNLEFVSKLAARADGIVHLAGMVGPDFTFEEVLGPNIIGTRNIYEAARANGILQVVYASSHHAVGFYKRRDFIDHQTAPRPDSHYGLSKAFGEDAGSYFADKFGLNVLAIRIGYVGETVIDERRLHTWISPRDLAQLIHIGLATPDLGYEVVYGVSQNPDPFFDNSNAERLGYRPQDRAVDFLADPAILKAKPDPHSPEGIYVGGHFAAS